MSIEGVDVSLVSDDEPTWMAPIQNYLGKSELPEKKLEARKILCKSLRYVLEEGVLYKRSYLQPLLRCIRPIQIDYVLREVHEG